MADNVIDMEQRRLELMVTRMAEEAAVKAASMTDEERDYEARRAAHEQVDYDRRYAEHCAAHWAAEQQKAEQGR